MSYPVAVFIVGPALGAFAFFLQGRRRMAGTMVLAMLIGAYLLA
jgi:hypothetical protein